MKYSSTADHLYINIIVLALILGLFGFWAYTVSAAPGEDYFVSDADTFTAWLEGEMNNEAAVCDAYEAIFSSDTCVSGTSDDNISQLAAIGALFVGSVESTNEADIDNPTVTLLDNRCVQEDGVVDFLFDNVTAYKLTKTAVTYDLSDGLEGTDFQTLSDLADGTYELTVYNAVDSAQIAFDIACDAGDDIDDDSDSSISVSCDVYPENPDIDQTVVWEVEGKNGDKPVSYHWSGDVSGSADFVTTSYGTIGEKEGFATAISDGEEKTARCSVTVGNPGGEIQTINQAAAVRTIENF